MPRPLCFVLMPFGVKPGPEGRGIDFDAVYRELIHPAIKRAELEPLRADEEIAGGIIHKPMFERLILCEYAVADLTTANANVFYELGVRHAVRPASTVLVFARTGARLPFDVAPLRGLPYSLGSDGKPSAPAGDRQALGARLREARAGSTDSPIFQLVDGFPDIQRLKTDVFRERVAYSEKTKRMLASARKKGVAAIRRIEASLGSIADQDAAVVVDLFLSFRAVKAWRDMVTLVRRMSRPLAESILVREQLALALNRVGRGHDAEQVLLKLLERRGPSSETLGILGRVYKDRWETALRSGKRHGANGFLSKAIETYRRGFEADWRDAYPGVNAITLMEVQEPPDPRRGALLPIVLYAVERRLAAGNADYWDHATRLELAVLDNDEAAAGRALADALAALREPWEAETTARNLRLIREARENRGDFVPWTQPIESELKNATRTG